MWAYPGPKMNRGIRAMDVPACVGREPVEESRWRPVKLPRVFHQPLDQYRITESNQRIVAAVLVAYLPDDLRVLVRHISGWIKRTDKGNGFRVGKTVEFFV